MSATLTDEIAATAARLVVEEGMEYGPAKRRAARDLGRRSARTAELPDNDQVEDEVREYLAIFCADTQPRELAALRAIAMHWMQRLAEFRPHLTGAVWRGTATRLNDIHLELYCDDSKAAELALIDHRIDYEVGSRPGPRGELVDVLSVAHTSIELAERVTVHLTVLDFDDLRGGLRPDASGRAHRGDLRALQQLAEPA
ncbi:MAG: hypothetical protein ABI702_11320 [Burkholderiales bacterium]